MMPSGCPTTDALRFSIGQTLTAEELAAFTSAYGSPSWIRTALANRGMALDHGRIVRHPHEGRSGYRGRWIAGGAD